MKLKDYQEKCLETAVYPGVGENMFYPVLGLAGETGEVCENIKKAVRDDGGLITKERKQTILKELGDVMWYISAVCSELGISLEDVAKTNIEKLASRKERNCLHGDGDDR